MPEAHSSRPASLKFGLALASILLALLVAGLDVTRWHPGFGYPDECNEVQLLEEAREGQALPLSFAKGCAIRFSQYCCAAFGQPSLFRLHLPVFLLFLLESWALYQLAKREFGEAEGLWALMLNALAASTWLRLRTLMSYAFGPGELLLLMAWMPRRERLWPELLWGFAAALCLLDYEGWILGTLILGLYALRESLKGEGPSFWALLGWGLGATLVLYFSRVEILDYWAVRHAASLRSTPVGFLQNIGAGLSGFFWGAPSLAYSSVSQWPCLPFYAWPGLALGLVLAWKERPSLLLWVLIGFLPLLSLNSAAETQRLVMAWPALCLLAAFGLERLAKPSALHYFLCIALLGVGAGVEFWAFERSMNAAYPSVYGLSQELENACSEIKAMNPAPEILTHFDDGGLNAGMARFYFAAEGLASGDKGGAVAIFEDEYASGLKSQGRLERLSPPEAGGALDLYVPGPAMRSRLEGVDGNLALLWAGLPPFSPLQETAAYIWNELNKANVDPWIRTVCYERLLGEALLRGIFPRDLVQRMQGERLQSAAPLLWAAVALQHADPAWSQQLEGQAMVLEQSLERNTP